ncbi:hypothetical protein THAOC_01843, partial [Thalassiosira oceanica]
LGGRLPEAARTEGMPARELDWVGPLAQADAALVASVHLRQNRSSPAPPVHLTRGADRPTANEKARMV